MSLDPNNHDEASITLGIELDRMKVPMPILVGLMVLLALSGAEASAATSESAAGITFTFDRNYTTGTYLDGMPWVVEDSPGGGVTITRMTPDFSNNQNGWAENPESLYTIPSGQSGCTSSKDCQLQTLDSRLTSTKRWVYKSPVSIYGALPRRVSAGTSVVKTKGSSDSACGQKPVGQKDCVISAAVLTVLASPPPPNSLRPPFVGKAKPHFVLSGFDIATDLPNLPLLGGGATQYTHAEVEDSFGDFSIPVNVLLTTEFGGVAVPSTTSSIRGGVNITYGCDYGMWVNGVLLSLAQTGTADQKRKSFYASVENAIDHFYAISSDKNWGSGGCIHHGRKSLIMWGGKILNSLNQGPNQSAAAAMASFQNGADALDQMTYTGTVTGEALWGQSPCSNDPAGNNTTNRHCDQRRDGGGSKIGSGAKGSAVVQDTPAQQVAAGKYSYAAYQMMSALYFGAAAVARIYGFESEWNAARSDKSDAFFRYVDRIASPPWNRACHSHCDSYLTSMHKEYGCNSSTCASKRGSSTPPPPGPTRLPPPSVLD